MDTNHDAVHVIHPCMDFASNSLHCHHLYCSLRSQPSLRGLSGICLCMSSFCHTASPLVGSCRVSLQSSIFASHTSGTFCYRFLESQACTFDTHSVPIMMASIVTRSPQQILHHFVQCLHSWCWSQTGMLRSGSPVGSSLLDFHGPPCNSSQQVSMGQSAQEQAIHDMHVLQLGNST